jgi:hypothetical protein
MAKRMMFVLAAALLAIGGLYVRSKNASSAHDQASAILRLDSSGAGASSSIESLKTYVHTHMGATVSYTLNTSYQKAVTAAQAAQAQQSSGNVYADAQRACAGHTDSITQAKCNQAYLQAHLTGPSPTPVPQPNLTDYQYNLRSPLWTPDLAGALMVGALAALVLGLWRLPKRRQR